MTLNEMLEALEPVSVEFPKFVMNEKRAVLWYRKFSKTPLDAFNRLVVKVCETCKYAPQLCDFDDARKALGGKNKGFDEHERCRPKFVRRVENYLTDTVHMVKESVGTQGYRFSKRRRMDLILQAFGHEWVNDQLAIDSPRACLEFVKAFGVGNSENGESAAHKKRYEKWTEKAFTKAWGKLYGREPSEQEMGLYE